MPTILSDFELQAIEKKLAERLEELSIETLSDGPRTHLGISEIGNKCSRFLYYKFRWMFEAQYSGRMLRLFKRGHREEERFINYLEDIGCTVQRFDENGKQFRVSGVMGHYGGSCDGIGIVPWVPKDDRFKFLLEFKTHNQKSFDKYLNEGLHKSKPMHYDQMCGYGWKMNIEFGIYFPENKNTDEIKPSVIRLDHERGMQLERKAEEIITAKEPPNKISENPAFFECKYCDALDVCHNGKIPLKNCRSCRMSTPVADAKWYCSRFNDIIPAEFIAGGCDGWVPI